METIADPATQPEQILETLKEIQRSLEVLESGHHALKQEWEMFAKKTRAASAMAELTYTRALKTLEDTNQDQLKIIRELKIAVIAYKIAMPIERLKVFLRPRISKLCQYPPRAMKIPNFYQKKLPLPNAPTISIVTPSFNQGNFLEHTILSIIQQKYPALEYVIQDAGSNDNTIEIINKYKDSLAHWESVKDKGQANALNLGYRHTTGEIMAYLNSDDLLLPGSLHYVANYFANNPSVDVVYGHRIIIDENNDEVGRWVLPRHHKTMLDWVDYIPQETVFWRRRVWDKIGAHFDERFRFALDWDLLLRFKSVKAKFARLPRFLGAFRVHPLQKTSANISTIGVEEMEQLRTRCHGRTVTMKEIKKNVRKYNIEHIILHRLYKFGLLRY